MKNIILFFLFVFISLNIYSQSCPAPVGEPNQTFCSQTAWALISESSDTLADLKVCGENLTWYSDSNGTIILPETTVLVSGTVYYVSQTINGCESPVLAITVTDKDCGCVKNPNFQTNQGTSNLNGYTFLQQIYPFSSNPAWTCNVNTNGGNGLPAAIPYTPGPDNSMSHDAVIVTPGVDPTLQALGFVLPRTSPFASCSSQAVRLNRNGVAPAKVTSMRKKFIAGEVFSFDYAIVGQDPSHNWNDLPFFQFKIFDENDVLIQSKCINGSKDDCNFNIANPSSFQGLIYSDWSCFQINTSGISGQAVTVEFSMSDCKLAGHWAYAYIDNLYAGDLTSSSCTNPNYGYTAITSVNAINSVDYAVCSVSSQPINQGCLISSAVKNIQFPLEFCGTYSIPSSSVLSNLTTYLYKGNTMAGTVQPVSTGTNNYCSTVNVSDISVLPFGAFSIYSVMEVTYNCGAPYSQYWETPKYNFKICPTAGCPLPLTVCSTQPGTGIGIFDLNQAVTDIKGNMSPNDVIVSFYETAADAEGGVNVIANPQSYQNTTSNTQFIYARLDFDWVTLGIAPEADCFDVIEMELNVLDMPQVAPVGETNQIFCSPTAWALLSETNETLADLKVCGEDLTWYSDVMGSSELPETTILVSGTTYYVSQTINGCESPLLAITVTESDCGCIKNPGFQTNQGTSNLDGYTFLEQTYTAQTSPAWSCNVNTDGGNGLPAATTFTPGPDNSMNHDAVVVTSGNDPTLLPLGIMHPRTSPLNTCSLQAVRLNRNNAMPPKITSMRKKFIAGEVLSFDYSIVAQGVENHTLPQLPFFQIKIYDENNILIQSQCIIANKEDCSFLIATTTSPGIIYSDWSCFQFDTSSISGKEATVEFTVAGCSLTGHYVYAYIDNLFSGDAASSNCINPLYGNSTLTSVNAPNTVDYGVCSVLSQPTNQGCVVSSLLYNVQFPIEICGTYNSPNGTLSTLNTYVYKDGSVVGSTSSWTSPVPNSYCASVTASDIVMPLYGAFSVNSKIGIQVNCPIPNNQILYTPLYNFKVCPVAVCPLPLTVCSTHTGSEIGIFDLNQSINEIKGNMDPNDVIVSFYETAADAEAKVNSISNPQNYQNTSPNNQVIYARLDVHWALLTLAAEDDCYDIVELELNVEDIPVVTDFSNLNPLIVADPNNTGNGVFDLTVQIPHIIGSLTNVDVTFYLTQTDAENEQNAIANPENYTGTHDQVIFVNVKDINTSCSNTTSFKLILDTTMNVEDPKEVNLKLYPNPADDILYLQSNQFGSEVDIKVFGIQGNLLYSDTKLAPGQILNLNVSEWASGVYFVKVVSENTITMRKFVKK